MNLPRCWKLVFATVVTIVVAFAFDCVRPPQRQMSARVLLASIGCYRAIGDRLMPGAHCRMRPGCSRYAENVIREHGSLKGGWLTIGRLLRCGPWTASGTSDPPPLQASPSG